MKLTDFKYSDKFLSEFCLGAMYFGSKINKEDSFKLLDLFVEEGGNFIDTANIYAYWVEGCKGGESESLIGSWLQSKNNRDNVFIATKLGFEYPGTDKGLSKKQIVEECEKSLRRLSVDSIDLLYSHGDDFNTPVEETLKAYDKLKTDGKIKHIGASNFSTWRIEQSKQISRQHNWIEYAFVQQRYSYLRPRHCSKFENFQVCANDEMLEYCAMKKMPFLAYSPLLGGAYNRPEREFSNQYKSEDSAKRLEVSNQIAQETGLDKNQIVLNWMIKNQIIPIVGTSSIEQMKGNLNASHINLSNEQLERLNNAFA